MQRKPNNKKYKTFESQIVYYIFDMKRYRTYRFLPGKFNKWLPTTVRYKLIRFIGLGHFSAYAVKFFHGSERSLPINGSFLLTSLFFKIKMYFWRGKVNFIFTILWIHKSNKCVFYHHHLLRECIFFNKFPSPFLHWKVKLTVKLTRYRIYWKGVELDWSASNKN